MASLNFSTQFPLLPYWGQLETAYTKKYNDLIDKHSQATSIFKSRVAIAGALAAAGTLLLTGSFYLSAVPLLAGAIAIAVRVRQYFTSINALIKPTDALTLNKSSLDSAINQHPIFRASPPYTGMSNVVELLEYDAKEAVTYIIERFSPLGYAIFKDKVQGYDTVGLQEIDKKTIRAELVKLAQNLILEEDPSLFDSAAKELNLNETEVEDAIKLLQREKGISAVISRSGWNNPQAEPIKLGNIYITKTYIEFQFLLESDASVTKADIEALLQVWKTGTFPRTILKKLQDCPAYDERLKSLIEINKPQPAPELQPSPISKPEPTPLPVTAAPKPEARLSDEEEAEFAKEKAVFKKIYDERVAKNNFLESIEYEGTIGKLPITYEQFVFLQQDKTSIQSFLNEHETRCKEIDPKFCALLIELRDTQLTAANIPVYHSRYIKFNHFKRLIEYKEGLEKDLQSTHQEFKQTRDRWTDIKYKYNLKKQALA